MVARVPQIVRGQPITARYLNTLGEAINANIEAIARPKSLKGKVKNQDGTFGGDTWEEAGRTTKSVRIFNPADATQYVDVDRIETVTLINQVTGESMTLQFNV